MIAEKYPDPSDLSINTIQKLFYRQIRSLSLNSTVDEKMKTFDLQFSDAWFN